MLNIKNLKLAIANKILLNDANLQIYKGQKIGLIGQNGVGKTTFFKMILGKFHPEEGEFFLSKNTLIGYVEQEIHDQSAALVDYVLSVHPLIIHEQTDLPEYYQLRPNAEKLLMNLGFKLEELYLPIKNFSGGWQMRVNLAKALFIPSDLLLLDEPTNHLDLETVMWLEDWLKLYQGLALIISHDREFLDNVTTHTLSISGQALTLYTGDYSTFETTRYMHIMQQQQMQAKNRARVAHLQSFVERFRAKASKAKQAQSRLKMIEKIQVAQALPKDVEFSVNFLEPEYHANKLIGISGGVVGYPDKILIENVTLDIFQESRIGLLGKNGIGKSTLIKALINGTTLLKGELYTDNKIKVGYFAQNTIDQLNMQDTPLGFLSRVHKNKREQELRGFLGGYGFNGDKVKEKIGNFSGGEKARLTIASIILDRPNVLFLDEPTNHLDMQMREELASGIQDFNGAIVIVSHDKFLLQSVVDEFYLINKQSLRPFAGSLNDYHDFLLAEDKVEKSNKSKSDNKKSTKITKSNPLKLKSDLKKLEEQIARLTREINSFEEEIALLNVKAPANENTLQEVNSKYAKHKQRLEDTELKWLDLNEQLNT